MMTSDVFYLKKLLREELNKRKNIFVATDWYLRVIVAENHSKVNKDHRNLITDTEGHSVSRKGHLIILISKFH